MVQVFGYYEGLMLASLLILSALLTIGFNWQILRDAFSGRRIGRGTWYTNFAGMGAGYGLGATILAIHFFDWHGYLLRTVMLCAGIIAGAFLGLVAFNVLIRRSHQ